MGCCLTRLGCELFCLAGYCCLFCLIVVVASKKNVVVLYKKVA